MKLELNDLSEILTKIHDYPWDHALYLVGTYPWRKDTPCAVLNPDEIEDFPEKQIIAEKYRLNYVLSVQQAQDLTKNTHEQIKNVTSEQLIDAFNFYYKNDAFIEDVRKEKL